MLPRWQSFKKLTLEVAKSLAFLGCPHLLKKACHVGSVKTNVGYLSAGEAVGT